jgi:recombination protein U
MCLKLKVKVVHFMNISYPNGKPFNPSTTTAFSKKNNPNQTFANRGMTLEEDLNVTNQYYLNAGLAVIHKKPTPVQIVSVDYPKRSAAVIKEAYFKQPSTTDYNGVYRGKYIDFEAKETKNKTSFPLNNFHEHQMKHMKATLNHGGICFVIIRFSLTDEIFLLETPHLLKCWEEQENGGRKSISKSDIENYGHNIKIGYNPRIDYLQVIDTLYFSS